MSPRRITIIRFCPPPAVAKNNIPDGERWGALAATKFRLRTARARARTHAGSLPRGLAAETGAGCAARLSRPGTQLPHISVTCNSQGHLTRETPRGRPGRGRRAERPGRAPGTIPPAARAGAQPRFPTPGRSGAASSNTNQSGPRAEGLKDPLFPARPPLTPAQAAASAASSLFRKENRPGPRRQRQMTPG